MTSYAQGSRFYVSDFDDSFDQMLMDFVDRVFWITSRLGKKRPVEAPHIEIYINSEGGDAGRALSLVELMESAKEQGVIIATYALHSVYSAGSLIAVAGSKGYRYTGQRAEWLLHFGECEYKVSSPLNNDITHRAIKEHFKNLVNFYVDNTTVSPETIGKWLSNETYLTAKDAIDDGLCDYFM